MIILNNMKNILKISFALLFAVCLISCSGEGTAEGGASTGSLTLTVDEIVVQAGGDDFVTVTVSGDNGPVTEGIRFIDKSNKILDIVDGKFAPEQAGEYTFMAVYNGAWSNYVTVNAFDFPIPALPEDTDEQKTTFKRRVMLLQFTSTGCSACPNMKLVLNKVAEDEAYSDKYILVSSHHDMDAMYGDDPAAYPGNDAFKTAVGVSSFPTLVMNLYSSYILYSGKTVDQMAQEVKGLIDQSYGNGLSGFGLAVNSDASEKGVVARVLVKSGVSETVVCRLAACLIEDGIVGNQNSAPDNSDEWRIHNNCIRMLDCNENSNYYGHSLGRMATGDTREYTFVFDNKDSIVKVENCKLMFYITVNETLQNTFLVQIGETVNFEYTQE